MMASITAYKRSWYYFRNVEYNSDAGYIFPESIMTDYTNFVTTRDATDLRTTPTVPGTFAVISLNMFTLKQTYLRRYYKAQNMIADLGGLIKGIIMIAVIMNYYVRDKLFIKKLVNKNISSYLSYNAMNKSVSLMTLINNYKEKDNFEMLNINKSDIRNIKDETPHSLSDVRDCAKIPVVNLKPTNRIQISSINLTNSAVRQDLSTKDKVDKKVIITQEALTTKNHVPLSATSTPYKIELTNLEVILPSFCFGNNTIYKKNLMRLEMYRKLVESQLDVNYIITKLNMIDKLTYIFAGDKYKMLLQKSVNPYTKQGGHKSSEYVSTFGLEELSQLSNLMATNIKNLTERV
jgi:hypothetical protein